MGLFSKKDSTSESQGDQFAKYIRTANVYIREGRLKDAAVFLEHALKLKPKDYTARALYERVQKELAKYAQQQSVAAQRSAQQKLDAITGILKNAELYIASKQFEQALKEISKVFAVDPNNSLAKAYMEQMDSILAKGSGSSADAQVQQRQRHDRAILKMYRELLREMWFDGKLTLEEQQELKKVREILHITDEEHTEIQKQVHIDAYVDALMVAWKDGTISDTNKEALKLLREKYGITMEEHTSAEAKVLWHKRTPPKRKKVLLVDDEVSLLDALQKQLKESGYDVTACESVEEAVVVAEAQPPAVIVSDLKFPQGKKDGIDFYEFIRSHPKLKMTPFVLISGVSDEFMMRAGIRLGVDTFLQKPFDLELLIATIEGKIKEQ